MAVRFAPCSQRVWFDRLKAGSASGVSGAIFCEAKCGQAIQHYAKWHGNRNEKHR